MSMEFQIKQVKFCYDKELILKGVTGDSAEQGFMGFWTQRLWKDHFLKCCAGILSPREEASTRGTPCTGWITGSGDI